MIVQGRETAENAGVFGQGLAEGLGAGDTTESIQRAGQGGQRNLLLLLDMGCPGRGICAEKNGPVGESSAQELGKAISPFFVVWIGAGQEKNIGSMQGRNRFAQIASRKNPTVSRQSLGREENDIDVPFDGQMLKTIIKE